MVRQFACRKCKSLASGKICPSCNSNDLSKDWSGLIIILEPEKSEVAKSLGILKSGRYALRVS